MTTLDLMRIFLPSLIAFLFGVGMTPFLTHVLYKYRFWKPRAGKVGLDGTPAETFNRLHEKREVGTPRAGGVLVWGSVLVTAMVLRILSVNFPDVFGHIDFISRTQTWLPLAALVAGGLGGVVGGYFEARGRGGVPSRVRPTAVAVGARVFA